MQVEKLLPDKKDLLESLHDAVYDMRRAVSEVSYRAAKQEGLPLLSHARDLEIHRMDYEKLASTLFACRFDGQTFHKSDEYQEKTKRLAELINDIRSNPPADSHDFINKYDDTVLSLEAITEEFAYKEGFMDAMMLSYQMKTEPKVGEDS